MGLIDSIAGGISKVMDPGGLVGGLAGLVGKSGMDALKSAMQNPAALLMPGGPAMLAFGAVMKNLGQPEPQAKGVANFCNDPQTTVKESILGMLQKGPGLATANGKFDTSMKINGDAAVQTPGGFTIAIKGEGNTSICIGIPQDSGPTSVKLGGNGKADLTISFDPTKATSIELPGGTKINIKSEPTEGGGKRCGCELPDGSKVIWDVIKQAGKDALGLAGIFGKLTGGGLGGVLMGPFGGAIAAAVKGGIDAIKDGQIARPGGGVAGGIAGGIGAGIGANFGIDVSFNRPGVGGTSNTGGTTGTGNTGGATSTSRTSGFSEGDQAMMGAVKNLTGDVEALKKKLADPNLKPEERQQLQFELQQKTQEMSQLISLFSNLLKILSDAANSIIGNIRQ